MSKNTRFEMWRELYPEAETWRYPRWLHSKINELVEAERWEIVTSLSGGMIIDQEAFTQYILQQGQTEKCN